MLQAQWKVPRADVASSLRASGTVTRIRPMSRGGCSPRRTGSLPVARQCSGWSVVAVPACGAVGPRRARAQGIGVAGGRWGLSREQRASATAPGGGRTATPDPVIWTVLRPERRAAAVALLAMLAAGAAARTTGGGRDEPGQVPAAGRTAAENPGGASRPGRGGVCPAVEQAAGS